MFDKDFFILDEDALEKVNDLIECLGLAIEKIILSNRIIKGNDIEHPSINGFKQMAAESVEGGFKERDPLDIF